MSRRDRRVAEAVPTVGPILPGAAAVPLVGPIPSVTEEDLQVGAAEEEDYPPWHHRSDWYKKRGFPLEGVEGSMAQRGRR